jgi:cytochrome c oxidase subunit 2
MWYLTVNFFVVKVFGNLQMLEFIWTIFPAIILIFIGVPSMLLLYRYDVDRGDLLTVKASGHQWYWRYDYSDFAGVEFDSYIKLSEDLALGEYRLLETDNRVVLPFGVGIRFIITSADVIHAWTIPRIAAKVDANAGFINTINLTFEVPGVYYGQCREICGANHSFIPICVEVTSLSLFKSWLNLF